MLTSHDAQWSLQSYRDGPKWYEPVLRPAGKVATSVRKYAANIRANYRRFSKANNEPEGRDLESLYYNPVFYLPLGHPDVFSLILADDFDPVDSLTAELTSTLESVSIAFAPDLPSLGFVRKDGVLRSPSAIWGPKRRADPRRLPPFLVFCKLKMEGLAAVGLGLSCQIAVWRTMIQRISLIAEVMERNYGRQGRGTGNPLIEPEDVRQTWCSLLDMQGCEEIGLLVFTTNLSAAFSIIGGVRTLTFEDVYRQEPGLAEKLQKSLVHDIISRHAQADGPAPKGDVRRLGPGHLFRWSHSSISVLPEQHFNPRAGRLFAKPDRLHGYVSARSRLQIPPGHVARCRARLLENLGESPQGTAPTTVRPPEEFFPYLAGLYDCDLDHGEQVLEEAGNNLVRAGVVVDNVEDMLRQLCLAREIREAKGRDVIDLETDVIVPVPKLRDESGRDLVYCPVAVTHFAPLGRVLPKMVERLCRPAPAKSRAAGRGQQRDSSISLALLMEAQRKIGVPVALRGALQYAFEDFALLTGDPFYFDVLLDLYDTFGTLYAVLTRHLPRQQLGRCEAVGAQGRPLLDEARVRHLSEIVAALHNAMLHRSSNAFRDANWRDMAMDLRGGLNQILLAADAPIKCGLGVLRRFAFDNDKARSRDATNRSPRDSVGCVMRVATTPGARCFKARFGVEKDARLAFFDVDVSHVLHVASYADYLHEAFHLVFEQALANKEAALRPLKSADDSTRHRLEEIFAQMLSTMFLFKDDRTTFIRHSVLSYSRDIASTGTSDKETCRRFTEVLLRLFLVVDPMRGLQGDPRSWGNRFPVPDSELDQAEKRFLGFVRKAGPFFSEYSRLWEGPAHEMVVAYTCAHFRAAFTRLSPYLSVLCRQAMEVYRLAAQATFPGENPQELAAAAQHIHAEIARCLKKGRPLVWSQYQGPGAVQPDPRRPGTVCNFEGGGLDPLPFVCNILHKYIGNICGAKDMRVHLLRTSGSARVRYKRDGRWWEYQADKGAAALFCCVPEARRRRLLKQIAILKSFWDVASELRARRLLEMLRRSGLDRNTRLAPGFLGQA